MFFGASRFDSKTGRSLLFFWLGPMTSNVALEPLFVLVDDHIHSARLMRRAMQMSASPARVAWIGNARRAERTLARLLGPGATQRPDMVIVDLKSYSGASAAFISRIGNLAAAVTFRSQPLQTPEPQTPVTRSSRAAPTPFSSAITTWTPIGRRWRR